jgi:hypothetical protein
MLYLDTQEAQSTYKQNHTSPTNGILAKSDHFQQPTTQQFVDEMTQQRKPTSADDSANGQQKVQIVQLVQSACGKTYFVVPN